MLLRTWKHASVCLCVQRFRQSSYTFFFHNMSNSLIVRTEGKKHGFLCRTYSLSSLSSFCILGLSLWAQGTLRKFSRHFTKRVCSCDLTAKVQKTPEEVKVRSRTLDIAPRYGPTPSHKRIGTARVFKGSHSLDTTGLGSDEFSTIVFNCQSFLTVAGVTGRVTLWSILMLYCLFTSCIGKGRDKGRARLIYASLWANSTTEALRYGTRFQGITPFYLPPTRLSTNGMNKATFPTYKPLTSRLLVSGCNQI